MSVHTSSSIRKLCSQLSVRHLEKLSRNKKLHDPKCPIEDLFKQINKTVEFAATGNNRYTPLHVVTIAYQLIVNTGNVLDDYRDWNRKQETDKTWDTFISNFTIAHMEIRDNDQSNICGGYQAQPNTATYQQSS